MTQALHIIIAGAGIGGLSAALALHREGFRVTVLEQAQELRELGVGIQMSPNGIGILYRWGLEKDINAIGQYTVESPKYSRDGVLIRTRPCGIPGGFDYPHIAVHRGKLQLMMYRALCERAGIDAVKLGRHIDSFEVHSDGVTVKATNRSDGAAEIYSGDLLIGADGIHSVVRQHFYPEKKPHYTGYVIWRGILPIEKFQHEKQTVGATSTWGDGNSFFNYYYMNQEQISFSICCPVGQSDDVVESWSGRGTAEEVRVSFGACAGPLDTCLDNMTLLMKMFVHDHETLTAWSFDRVTLMGDAAHAMLPFAGQGAASAMEDAEKLAAELKQVASNSSADILAACRRYESERLPATAKVRDYCRERGGIFEEYLAVEKMTDNRWKDLPVAEKEKIIAGIDWANQETFLRKLY
jgi:2-polyprenyl-6-methoxyphenol hydroxylase-like FAD-dependent oxidoreductase